METLERQVGVLEDALVTVAPLRDDRKLAYAYLRFEQDGKLDTIFGEQVPSLMEFVTARLALPTLAAYRHTDGGLVLIGLGWLNLLNEANPENVKTDASIAFFCDATGQEKLHAGRFMVDWVFLNLNVKLMLTLSAKGHRASIAYVSMLGFELYGPIPRITGTLAVPDAGYLGAMTRENWEGRRRCLP